MNKKLNTALFLIAATVANIIMIAIFFLVPFMLYMRFLATLVPTLVTSIMFPVILVGAIIIAYFTYNNVMGKIIEKVDMDKYFDPIFKQKNRNKNN